MSPQKPLAALAAVTAALAVAVPAASASAATSAPAVRTAHVGVRGALMPGSLPCQFLVGQIQFAALTGNTGWESLVSNAFVSSGCGGAAI
jgi:hypothetical protein